MGTVFLNGRFLDADGAAVSAFDAGLQHGVGLFETMLGELALDGRARVPDLDEHIDLLVGSARELGLSDRLRSVPLGEAVLQTVERSGLARARVRITVTGGDLNLLRRREPDTPAPPVDPTVLIVAQAPTAYPEQLFERGVLVTIADARANPLNPLEGHKTLNYWWRLRELQRAAERRAGEALVLQVTNFVSGGCVSNLLALRAGEAVTPMARGEELPGAESGAPPPGVVLASPVRPGVTRAWAIRELAGMGVRTTRRLVRIADVLDADEVVLTNSSWGVLPVVQVEGKTIGSGAVGPVARTLIDRWRSRATGTDRDDDDPGAL